MLGWLFGGRRRPVVPLVLYTRRGCGLCEQMKEEIALAHLSAPWSLTEVDVDQDPELCARYGDSVPVLWIGGRKAFQGRLHPGELAKRFEKMAAAYWRASAVAEDIAARPRDGAR